MEVGHLDGELLKLRHELHQLKIVSDARETVIQREIQAIFSMSTKKGPENFIKNGPLEKFFLFHICLQINVIFN